MITAIAIKNLRGIREGELKDLAPLTILVGPNNSGKSTVLDAIMIAASPDPSQAVDSVQGRRVGLEERGRWLLWREGRNIENESELKVWESSTCSRTAVISRTAEDNPLSVSCHYQDSESQTPSVATARTVMVKGAKLRGQPLKTITEVRLVDPFGAGVHSRLDELLTQATLTGLEGEVTALLSELAPEVKAIRILTARRKPVVHLVYDFGSLPEATAGDGVRMLLRLALELAAPVGGVELIEEPEMHMHPAAIRLVARAMLAAVKRGIQLVVSTHNLDLIDSVLGQCPTEELDKIAVFRLALVQGELKSTRYSGQEAQYSRTQIEEDLR